MDTALLKEMLAALDVKKSVEHIEWLTKNTPDRLSGGGQDRKAAEYICETMASYGLETKLLEFEAYNSHPLHSEVRVVYPQNVRLKSLPCGHIKSTPKGGQEFEVVYLGSGGEEDYAGKDVEGKPCCPDITKMPHLLVAGTTGSGKSICLSSLIISLLYKYGPDELRFILVDPKQSEFISYESLPHLIINEIISDVDKAIKALNWAIKEMERRYGLFKEMTLSGNLVRNLNEYNAHLPEGEEKLPKIVIILDEFGDLMLQRKKDIESRIIRLVQKARACGIHLILATQRPSVDCITGLIKSNLPTRIGFKVNSFDDSRTIFDIGGAEKLLGAGDMYFRSAQAPDLARIQGCFIDSPEVQAVTDFVKKNNETYFDQSVSDFINTVEEPEGTESAGDDGGEGDVKIDDKFIQALKFCVTSNQASVSMLQRRFPIGYVKACKIIDWMENMNYITQSEGSKPRKVLLSLDEFTRIYGDVDD